MGHGASVSSNSCSYLFCADDILDGRRYLCEDDSFRSAFVDFVRRGLWVEHLHRFMPEEQRLIISLETLAREKLCMINEYAVPRMSVDELYKVCNPKQHSVGDLTLRTKYSQDSASDLYYPPIIPSDLGFTRGDLAAILFTALYPVYIATVDEDPSRSESRNFSASTDSELAFAVRSQLFFAHAHPDHIKRARDVLHGPAQRCNEEDLRTALSQPTFPLSVVQALDAHKMAITIVDSQTETFPIVYANAAFTALSGYTLSELVQRKRNLLVLSGPESETSQLALLHEATAKGQSAKLALTCHTRGQRSFLNLIAMRGVGRYSVAIHTAVNKDLDFAALPVVDDMLRLLSLVIQVGRPSRPAQCTSPTAGRSQGLLYPPSLGGSADSADMMPALQIRVRHDGSVSQYHEGIEVRQGTLYPFEEGDNESCDPSSKKRPPHVADSATADGSLSEVSSVAALPQLAHQ